MIEPHCIHCVHNNCNICNLDQHNVKIAVSEDITTGELEFKYRSCVFYELDMQKIKEFDSVDAANYLAGI